MYQPAKSGRFAHCSEKVAGVLLSCSSLHLLPFLDLGFLVFLFFLGSMNTHRPTGTEIRILAGGAGSLVGWLICGILRRTRLQQHAAELGFCFVFCFRWCCTGSVRKNEEEPGLPRDQLPGPKLFSTAEARTSNSSSRKKKRRKTAVKAPAVENFAWLPVGLI